MHLSKVESNLNYCFIITKQLSVLVCRLVILVCKSHYSGRHGFDHNSRANSADELNIKRQINFYTFNFLQIAYFWICISREQFGIL